MDINPGAYVIHVDNGRNGYYEIIKNILIHGEHRMSRKMATRDMGHTTIVLHTPRNALPVAIGRGIHPAIGAIEALQLIAGVARHEQVLSIAPQFKKYVEDDNKFYGAYGARVGVQVGFVIDKLINDPGSRQAVITLWNPALDNVPGKHDYPCTIALNFSFNAYDQLELDVLMRSNDVWLGLPYDMFQFSQLHLSVANALNASTGKYRHTTWSLHMYDNDIPAAEEFINKYDRCESPFIPVGIGTTLHSWHDIRSRAFEIMNGTTPYDATASEQWYVTQMQRYMQ